MTFSEIYYCENADGLAAYWFEDGDKLVLYRYRDVPAKVRHDAVEAIRQGGYVKAMGLLAEYVTEEENHAVNA